MKKVPIGRIIATVFALMLFVLGIYCLSIAHEIHQEFTQREQLRPVDIAVDFSKPGDFTGDFHQTHEVVCGGSATRFFLKVPKGTFDNTFTPDAIKQQLQFDYAVTGSNEGETWDYKPTPDEAAARRSLLPDLPQEQFIELFYLKELLREESDYHLTISVTKGIPELAGVPQRLFVATEVCGCEMLGIAACNLLTFVSWSIAIILFFIVGIITIVKKRRVKKLNDTTLTPQR